MALPSIPREYPDAERRTPEDAFGRNDFDAVREAIEAAIEADGTRESVAPLTGLQGIDVPVASAFLQFNDPDRYVVIGERE